MPRSGGTATSSPARRSTSRARAVGRRGAVVVGEEGAAAVGRYGGVVVGDRYESYDAWKAVAAVGAGIAIGTMLAKPPAAATTVVVQQSTYYYHDNVYYTRVMTGGDVAYQVVDPPAGAIITTLPAGCTNVNISNVPYMQCGTDALHESADGLSSGRREVSDPARPPIARRVARPAPGVAAGRRGRRAGDAREDRRAEPVEGRRLRHVLHDRRRRTPLRASVRDRRGAIGRNRHRAVARRCGPACRRAAARRRALAARAPGRRSRAPVSTSGRRGPHPDLAHRVRARHPGGDYPHDPRVRLPCGSRLLSPAPERTRTTASPTPS